MKTILILVAACAFPAWALAQSAADRDNAAAFVSQMVIDSHVTEVSGLVVVAKPKAVPLSGVEVVYPVRCLPPRRPTDRAVPAPRLVSTYPGDGETVKPGYAVLRLTFDLPMACRGSVSLSLLGACISEGEDLRATEHPPNRILPPEPRSVEIWRQSYNRQTLLILCKLEPRTRYEMRFNQGKAREHFQGLSGREPEAGHFAFETSDAPPVMTVAELVDRDAELGAVLKRTQGSEARTGSLDRQDAQATSLVH